MTVLYCTPDRWNVHALIGQSLTGVMKAGSSRIKAHESAESVTSINNIIFTCQKQEKFMHICAFYSQTQYNKNNLATVSCK